MLFKREKVDHTDQFAVLHQRQTDVAPNAVLQEIIVPDEPSLKFHISAYVRLERLLDDAHMMLAYVYLGFQRFNVQIRSLPQNDALDGLACLAAHTFNMHRV